MISRPDETYGENWWRYEQTAYYTDGLLRLGYELGNDVYVSHETCDIVDFTWTLSHYLMVTGQAEWADKIEKAIYNAGLGAITKDFKSLQYFSSPNQFIATGTSNHNIYKHGSTWMAWAGVFIIGNGQSSIDNDACATGWFDLLGRKLAGKPTQKGVYINKGKKQVANTESCIFIR